jgi:Copper type II ascorbate-dependent monooxygenase, C-terminal domain
MPGDRLITTCGYDTSAETTTVAGGLATSNEMCFNFIEYYPATTSFFYCQSGKYGSLGYLSDCSGTVVYFDFTIDSKQVIPLACRLPSLPTLATSLQARTAHPLNPGRCC